MTCSISFLRLYILYDMVQTNAIKTCIVLFIGILSPLGRQVICNSLVSCKANGVGNQLGALRYTDLLAIL